MLAKYEWGIEDIPFYFMVFSNKNEVECKIFEIIIDEATKFQHYQNLENIKKYYENFAIPASAKVLSRLFSGLAVDYDKEVLETLIG